MTGGMRFSTSGAVDASAAEYTRTHRRNHVRPMLGGKAHEGIMRLEKAPKSRANVTASAALYQFEALGLRKRAREDDE